jgi:hypothetical protein
VGSLLDEFSHSLGHDRTSKHLSYSNGMDPTSP